MQGLLFVLEIIFIMFLMSKRMISILLWVMSLMMFQMSYESGNEQIYLEAIEDYPIQDASFTLGKAMTSLILSTLAISIIRRSRP